MAVGGYLISTQSGLLQLINRPLEVHNYGLTFNTNCNYPEFSTKIEHVKKKIQMKHWYNNSLPKNTADIMFSQPILPCLFSSLVS